LPANQAIIHAMARRGIRHEELDRLVASGTLVEIEDEQDD